MDKCTSKWVGIGLVCLGGAQVACASEDGARDRFPDGTAPGVTSPSAPVLTPDAPAGSNDEGQRNLPGLPGLGGEPATPRALIIAEEMDLAALFPESAQLVGVAVAPAPLDGTGTRYVLEATTGLYALEDGQARLVFDLQAATALRGTETTSPPVELTDVAIDPFSSQAGAPAFIATAENDGFAFGLHNSLLQSYFCYFPEVREEGVNPAVVEVPPSVSQELRAQGVVVKERTEAVAISDLTGQLFAQPRTIIVDSGNVAGSELFVFEQTGGQPVATRRFDDVAFSAGGMVVAGGVQLVLGYQGTIYAGDRWGDPLRRVGAIDLEQPVTITGMALDHTAGLFVLDGAGKRLLRIELAELDSVLGGVF